MKTVADDIIDEIVRRLVVEFQPEKIVLFGSHAWGHPDEESDIDLLVIVPESRMTPAQRAERAHRCLRGLNVPKDILVKTHEEVERFRGVRASLERRILEEGRALYG
ncbi:MAG: nucleotidyltransferase domain-containing protein [Armatimonadetes bacterium]|nr:nucleotidyltransferase domain-containing protein [Armatimonadota bacterium]